MVNRFVLCDLETVALADASQWLAEIQPNKAMVAELNAPIVAAKNLIDPVKIAADIAKKTAARAELPALIAADMEQRRAELLEWAAIDADLCQIVAMGYQTDDGPACCSYIPDVAAERMALNLIWSLISTTRPLVGYGLTWMDAGVLVRRSQLLDVIVPAFMYEQGKFRHPQMIELADRVTLNGMIEQRKGRGLDYHCRRLGLQIEDAYTGKDIAALYAAGNVEAIKSHCLSDIRRLRFLAERLRVIPPAPQFVLPEVSTGAF
jgi:hypothetical protein